METINLPKKTSNKKDLLKQKKVKENKEIKAEKLILSCIKTEFQKIVNFLDTTSDDKDLPNFVTKNGLKFIINQKEITMLIKKLELKHQC